MIDWDKTVKLFGYNSNTLPKPSSRPTVCTKCNMCNKEGTVKIRTKSNIAKYEEQWFCRDCNAKNPKRVQKLSIASKKSWKSEEYKNKISVGLQKAYLNSEYKNKISMKSKLAWLDDEYRKKVIRYTPHTAETKEKLSILLIQKWKEESYKKKISDSSRKQMLKQWQDRNYRDKMVKSLSTSRGECPKVSSLQETLYSLLDDLDIKYHRERNDGPDDPECKIGPWGFDCMIPRKNRPDLLIEVQGNYWHSRRETLVRDQQKASYIQNNFPGQYELKYIWEHEFLNKNQILETLKYWLGITEVELIDFPFNIVEIKKCKAIDYKPLLLKYHYLTNIGMGGIAFGAYLNELIAVCVFSPLGRQNIKIMSYNQDETRELSRLCIHPKYQKKNFASWFVSRCIKMLDNKYKCIVSYCDTTFNHDGAVYKACNFRQDKVIKPDYWYVSKDGWAMHKKTLYNHAKKMSVKEKEYAEKNEYERVYGRKKLRFVYER